MCGANTAHTSHTYGARCSRLEPGIVSHRRQALIHRPVGKDFDPLSRVAHGRQTETLAAEVRQAGELRLEGRRRNVGTGNKEVGTDRRKGFGFDVTVSPRPLPSKSKGCAL